MCNHGSIVCYPLHASLSLHVSDYRDAHISFIDHLTLLKYCLIMGNSNSRSLECRYFLPEGQRRLYGDLAWLWPIISLPAEHIRENEEFARMIRERSPDPVRTLLHLGCGGGHDDFTLKRHFQVTGVDLSTAMLEKVKQLNPELEYHLGDMRTIRLVKTFDSVIIGDSIGYMLTKEELLAVSTSGR